MMTKFELYIALTAVLTLANVQTSDDVIITVRYDPASVGFVNILFSSGLFTSFYGFLCKGDAKTSEASYNRDQFPNPSVEQISHTIGVNQNPRNYSCMNNRSISALVCEPYRGNPADKISHVQTFRISSLECASVCVGLVWFSPGEQIRFNTTKVPAQFCNTNCSCASATTTTTESVPTPSPPTTTLTVQGASPGGEDGSDDKTPVIVGVVVAIVVVIAVIVVVAGIIVWRRRKQQRQDIIPEYSTTPSTSPNINMIFIPEQDEDQVTEHPRNERSRADDSLPENLYASLEFGDGTTVEHPYARFKPPQNPLQNRRTQTRVPCIAEMVHVACNDNNQTGSSAKASANAQAGSTENNTNLYEDFGNTCSGDTASNSEYPEYSSID